MNHLDANCKIIKTAERESDGAIYRYELSQRHISGFQDPLFSITVEMLRANDKTTRAKTEDAFSDSEKAISLFEKLVKSLATPIDLAYVLEDELIN